MPSLINEQNSKLGSAKIASAKRSSTKVLNQPDPALATGSAPQRLTIRPGSSFLLGSCNMSSSLCSETEVSRVLSPAGGAGMDVMSREAEGQQGLEPTVQVTSVRQNSLDIFSPARDGQLMPSQINTFSPDFKTWGLICVTDSRIQGAAGDPVFGRPQGKKNKPMWV